MQEKNITPGPFDNVEKAYRPVPTGKTTREGHPIYHNPAVDKQCVLLGGTLYTQEAYSRAMRSRMAEAAPDMLASLVRIDTAFRAIYGDPDAYLVGAAGGETDPKVMWAHVRAAIALATEGGVA